MSLHIDEICKKVPEGRHAVLVVDGASWHGSQHNRNNLTLIKLPPYSPELNPMEQVWSWLKRNFLSNRCYLDYDDIVDAACSAWGEFIDKPELAESICTRDWATL